MEGIKGAYLGYTAGARYLAVRMTGSRGVMRLRGVGAEGSWVSLWSTDINALPLLR